jgi:hypothetical protein
MTLTLRTKITLLVAASITAACVAYAPAPYYGSNYDRAWNAALGGVQDAGVSITPNKPEKGHIRGTPKRHDVTQEVVRPTDGSVRVNSTARATSAMTRSCRIVFRKPMTDAWGAMRHRNLSEGSAGDRHFFSAPAIVQSAYIVLHRLRRKSD